MEAKVCKNCKRLFQYIFGPEICPNCIPLLKDKEDNNKELVATLNPAITEEEKIFENVKLYIIQYPSSTIMQIASANKVHPTQILNWVREERLEFSDSSKDAWFKCLKCGIKIKSGILCGKCKAYKI